MLHQLEECILILRIAYICEKHEIKGIQSPHKHLSDPLRSVRIKGNFAKVYDCSKLAGFPNS